MFMLEAIDKARERSIENRKIVDALLPFFYVDGDQVYFTYGPHTPILLEGKERQQAHDLIRKRLLEMKNEE